MSLGMYNASVPVFVKHMGSLSKIMDKGAEFAETKGIDPLVLLNSRLYLDMYPLARQVQEVAKHVRWACSMLGGQGRPDVAMPETTFPELKQMIDAAIVFANGFQPDQINGSETRPVVLEFPGMKLEFTGESYLLGFALPNFFFHMTSAYGILRSVGVDIGKLNFLAL